MASYDNKSYFGNGIPTETDVLPDINSIKSQAQPQFNLPENINAHVKVDISVHERNCTSPKQH